MERFLISRSWLILEPASRLLTFPVCIRATSLAYSTMTGRYEGKERLLRLSRLPATLESCLFRSGREWACSRSSRGNVTVVRVSGSYLTRVSAS